MGGRAAGSLLLCGTEDVGWNARKLQRIYDPVR